MEKSSFPKIEDALAGIVRQTRQDGRKLRVAGYGHSSSLLVETEDVLVSLDMLKGVEGQDENSHRDTIQAGMTVEEAGKALHEIGMAMHNLGDVDVQTARSLRWISRTMPTLCGLCKLLWGSWVSTRPLPCNYLPIVSSSATSGARTWTKCLAHLNELIESNIPVIVQFSRLDSSPAENAIANTTVFPLD